MLVAPVTVGDNLTSGAGSVIRHDVPDNAMVYSENSQRMVEEWKPAWERTGAGSDDSTDDSEGDFMDDRTDNRSRDSRPSNE